jgi:hypothetical protein
MEHNKKLALYSAQYKVSLWHLDDIFVIWPRGPDRLQNYFSRFNSLRSSIQFTMEVESNCMIHFMDILVLGKGMALTRKPPILANMSTSSDYLLQVKTGIIHSHHNIATICQ